MSHGKICKGDVVVVPFPFSDLTQAKRRPALVLSVLEGDDLILCQITSQTIKKTNTLFYLRMMTLRMEV